MWLRYLHMLFEEGESVGTTILGRRFRVRFGVSPRELRASLRSGG
jgi:hypothetical protein